jgi:MerR family transcriptional regulator, copper efflux regulator
MLYEGGVTATAPDDLMQIGQVKPLGFSLEEMQELHALLHDLVHASTGRSVLPGRLRTFSEAATARVTALREQLAVGEGFAGDLDEHR